MFRTPRFAAGALLLVALAASTACAESKLSESESAPTTPPPLGTPAPGVTVEAAPTVADLPEVCGISDAWGLAVIRATDPAQAAGASPAELEAGLEEQAAAFEAAEPTQAEQIRVRTEVAKAKLAGTATEADTEADRAAVDALYAWYQQTCGG